MNQRRMVAATIFSAVALLACSSAFCQGGFGEADENGDKKVDKAELEEYVSGKMEGFDRFTELFAELDADEDGAISEDEFEDRMQAIQTIMSREEPKMEEKPERRKGGQAKKRRPRKQGPSLKVGQEAPSFKLKSLDGESETDIADYKGKKPVVLIFGSYT